MESELKESNILDDYEWAMGTFKDDRIYEHLRPRLRFLIGCHYLTDDYAIEKFIKAFCEPLVYLESSLLESRGIHPSKLDLKKIARMLPVDVVALNNEVYEIMKSEIERQAVNFDAFLSSCKLSAYLAGFEKGNEDSSK